MSEYFEHNPGDHEDPKAGPTWLVGFIGVVLLAVIFLGLTAVYYRADERMAVDSILNPKPMAADVEAAQLERIEGEPRWVGDRLVIPIEQAMAKVAKESP